MDNYIVYLKTDSIGTIIEINSSAFLADMDGWIYIDEGIGDKYHHAQGNYLKKGLIDEHGRYNYQYINGTVMEIPQLDKPPIPTPIDEDSELAEAIEAATTIAGLKAALLGKAGLARVKGKKLDDA